MFLCSKVKADDVSSVIHLPSLALLDSSQKYLYDLKCRQHFENMICMFQCAVECFECMESVCVFQVARQHPHAEPVLSPLEGLVVLL